MALSAIAIIEISRKLDNSLTAISEPVVTSRGYRKSSVRED